MNEVHRDPKITHSVGVGEKAVEALVDRGYFSENNWFDRKPVAAIIEEAAGVNDLVAVLTDIVDATEKWNAAMETIIGKQPNTGIGLKAARELLKKYDTPQPAPRGDSEMIKAMLHERSLLENRMNFLSSQRSDPMGPNGQNMASVRGAIEAADRLIEIARQHGVS